MWHVGRQEKCIRRFGGEGNIKTYLQEVGCRVIGWTDVAEDKVQVTGTCACDNEPSGSVKCGEFLD